MSTIGGYGYHQIRSDNFCIAVGPVTGPAGILTTIGILSWWVNGAGC